ncbi:TEX9 protein, partial [Polyodon spathula]|nr:TEX9 protein [Polyodon spathula]
MLCTCLCSSYAISYKGEGILSLYLGNITFHLLIFFTFFLCPWIKKPLSARTENSVSTRPLSRPTPAPVKKPSQADLLAKEEEYKRLNAELEARTSELVHQAEEVMREQEEVLSRPISSHLDVGFEGDDEDFSNKYEYKCDPVSNKEGHNCFTRLRDKESLLMKPQSGLNMVLLIGRGMREIHTADDVAVLEDFADFSLAKTINKSEGQLEEDAIADDAEDDVIPSVGIEMGSGMYFFGIIAVFPSIHPFTMQKALLCLEHQKIEQLKAENKKLEKHKTEFMTGFKKQLKRLDILKRQKVRKANKEFHSQ